MRHIHFFAVHGDLIPIFEFVETGDALKYTLIGNFLISDMKNLSSTFERGAKIPSLGIAAADSSAACPSFLVSKRETPINLRHFGGIGGDERVCIDQLANPDTIVIAPGGIWKESIALKGHVGTASDSDASQILMKRFQAAIRKLFTKVKAFYLGQNAFALLNSGGRLTSSAYSPNKFDLIS